MRPDFFHSFLPALALSAAAILSPALATAEPRHGIAMYGDPALPPDFVSLPYANPDAPTGGRIVTGEVGGFDSLNPYILKGSTPWQLRFLTSEALMGRNWDEPFALYGLLAESIETGPNREWVEFTLRPEARFSDGSPVTIEDVMWSYETLGTEGHPRYRGAWDKVASMEQTGPRSLRFTFTVEDRELALIIGMRPILKKAQWDGLDFTESGLDTIPITSAPYTVTDFEAGRYVELTRNPDYWGRDLPLRAGVANLDTIRMEFFGDETAAFEAFKAGIVNSNREFNVEKWNTQYDFPAVQSGAVVKSVIPHGRPSGMTGFAMNTRKPLFSDWRVRQALLEAFNFQYINDTMTGGAQPRITSYFSNSILAMRDGPATGRVADFLAPFASELPPGTIKGYALPVSDGTARNRAGLARATALLQEAGWTVQDGVLADASGTPFAFEILLSQGAGEPEGIANIYKEALERLGIAVTITVVDNAQYTERTDAFDFDMTYYRRGLSLSPGNEQYLYWGCAAAQTQGSRNLMGMCSPPAEAMIERLLNSESQADFRAAARALDRILTAGRYVIPFYQWNISRIAHDSALHYPETIPIYGDWIEWQPDVWWWDDRS